MKLIKNKIPKNLLRNDIKSNKHQPYLEDGSYFCVFENGELGISSWHHSVGWIKENVKFWFKPDIETFSFIENEKKTFREESLKRGIIIGS